MSTDLQYRLPRQALIDKAPRICDNSIKKNRAPCSAAEKDMAENEFRSKEYRELPEHTSHAEYGPLNPDISCFRESAVTAAEENIFQGTVPPGEEENPYTAARRKKKDKKRHALLSRFLAGAVRAGAAAFGLLLLVGLIVLLNRNSSDSGTALQAREILEAAQRPLQSVPDLYGPAELGGVWNGVPAAPHKYDLEHPVIVKEANCIEEGEIRFVCSECGVILNEALPAHGHVPSGKVTENEVASSCLEQGTADEVVYCSVCGEELSREKVARALGPHSPKEPVEENRKEASCTEDGAFDTVIYCEVCGEELSRETTVLKASGHTEGEAVVENETDPSCTEEGGYDTVVYCTVCGEEISRETTVLEALGHTEGEAVVENETDPSCTEEGGFDTVVYCTVCGEEVSRETTVLEALGHDYAARTTAASCTARGYTTHTCSRCGDSYADSYTAALGHNYTARVTAATCTARGYTTHTCSRCNDTYTDTYTAALGHSYTARVTAATCTARGYTTHTCSRCNDSYVDSYTAMLAHNFNNATSSTCSYGCGTRAVTISYNAAVRGFNYVINDDFITETQRSGIYIAGITVIDLADNSSFNSIEYDSGMKAGTISPAGYAAVSGHQYELRLHCGTSTVIYSNRVTVA